MNAREYTVIDPQSLPKHFNAADAETRIHAFWQQEGVNAYDPAIGREQTYVVDTPPPTVSGSLHIGHVFSYTHTDIIVRYRRMQGMNIMYPMGWDDNGLPTERRVQNYFHIQCDPNVPYVPGLKVEPATAVQRKEPARPVSRANFIEICHQLTEADEQAFKELWQRAGLSVDWTQTYATVDDHCRRASQMSFLDLYRKGHVYSSEAPTMWDTDFQTAIAQAELEDRQDQGAFYHVAFGVKGEERGFTIATTRPELLAACVGVTAHPSDTRYKDLFGKEAVTPLYHVPVPIFPSELADPEKGTGILMVCTFGDATDVDWWRQNRLALRQIVGRNGRMVSVTFGDPGWESLSPDEANRNYAAIVGKGIKAAKKIVADQLRDPVAAAITHDAATPSKTTAAPLQSEPETLTHMVKYYEKGSHPIEFITTRQWFVRLLDKKDALIKKGREIRWYPEYMGKRYENWTENLAFDWCVSRQRYFGVSIPLWYRLDADGNRDYDNPLLPDQSQLPVDPMSAVPPGYTEEMRGRPGGFVGESDIFDTWFTSSMSPQIMSGWTLDPERHSKLYPMDIRPQSHDIIRTWAFYTIVKAALHDDTIPWHSVVISGFIVDPDRKKMSKSKGNVVTPMAHLEQHGADGVRYWAAQANLGTDMIFDETVMKVGRRLVTKLYNAGKFVLSQSGASPILSPANITAELDRAFVAKLRGLVDRSTASFERLEFARVIAEVESFFWHSFTDTFLELTKGRAKGEGVEGGPAVSADDRNSAIAALRLGFSVLLRMFAPFLPYITEEVWGWAFAGETGIPSIHRAPWPAPAELAECAAPQDERSFDAAVGALGAIHKHKTLSQVSLGTPIVDLELAAEAAIAPALRLVWPDVAAAARVEHGIFVEEAVAPQSGDEEVAFAVKRAEFGEARRRGDQ